MRTSFTLVNPNIVSRAGLIDIWTRFITDLAETLADRNHIHGYDLVVVTAEKVPDSSDSRNYSKEFGFPLQVQYHLANVDRSDRDRTSDRYLHLYEKNGMAAQGVLSDPKLVCSGSRDGITSEIALVIKKQWG